MSTHPVTAKDLDLLRAAFGSLETLDPCGPTYRKLCKILDRASDDALLAAVEADIKFVSALARNRIARREADALMDDFNYVGSRHHY